jgi:hypothetical protein
MKLFLWVSFVLGVFSQVALAENFDCTKIKISRVYVQKPESPPSPRSEGCFARHNPCSVDFRDAEGVSRTFRFLAGYAPDKERMDFSWNCIGVYLDSKGTGRSEITLPKQCRIKILFPRGHVQDPETGCECEGTSCKSLVDARARAPSKSDSGAAPGDATR